MLLKLTLWRFPKRYLVVAMVFVGYVMFFGILTNIGMVVVAMTSPRNIRSQNGTVVLEPEYNWTSMQKTLVISSLAYGRLLIPVGGVLAGKIGGSTLYCVGLLLTSIVSLCLPFCLHLSFYLFVLGNALTGVFESFSYASVSEIWSRWIPPNERAKLISISAIGPFVGVFVSFGVSGCILHYWGWPSVYYVSGIGILIWTCIWFLLVKNDPSDDTWISDVERTYIQNELKTGTEIRKLSYPWKSILTCVPLWTACLSKFTAGIGLAASTVYLPQYIKDTKDIDIKQIGFISMIPSTCSIVAMPLTGFIFDYIRSKKILSLTNVHKLYASLGLFMSAVPYLMTGLWPNFIICVGSMSVFHFFLTFVILEVQIVVLDLAPRYAAFMNSLANFFYTIGTILTPIFVGSIVTSHSQSQWSICFIVFGILFGCVAILCLKFGSGELQRWANHSDEKSSSMVEVISTVNFQSYNISETVS